MKQIFSLRMEVRPVRVFVVLLAIPALLIGSLALSGIVIRLLGYDLQPLEELRYGMSMENAREILGEPEGHSTMIEANGIQRDDWWYPNRYDIQLTFKGGRLESCHSKDYPIRWRRAPASF